MWQSFLVFYFLFGTASYLLRRVLAQKFSHHNRLINAVFFVFFLLPVGFVLVLLFPHNLNVGITNVALLLGGSVIWPLFSITAFRVNQTIDVGIYAVINNLSPLFTLALAIPFLGERLTLWQFAGIVLLIVSGIVAITPHFDRQNRLRTQGILFAILSTVILGTAVAYERFMLNRVDFGTYIILGWGAQIVWMALLAGREWKYLPDLIKSVGLRTITAFGLTSALRAVCFILALFISHSASIISGASDFLSLTVVVAAFFVLGERDHIVQKSIGAVVGISGLLLLTL